MNITIEPTPSDKYVIVITGDRWQDIPTRQSSELSKADAAYVKGKLLRLLNMGIKLDDALSEFGIEWADR